MVAQPINWALSLDSRARNPPEGRRFHWALKWGFIFGLWTLLGTFYSSRIYVGVQMQGMNHSFWRILASELIGCWYGFFLYTVVILWLIKRVPIESSSAKLNLAIHLPVFVALSFLHSMTVIATTLALRPYDQMTIVRPFGEMVTRRFLFEFHLELIVYLMILGAGYAYDYYQRYRERERRTAHLEAQLALAQLQVLKMQLQPHFLFNTINGIVGLVRDEKNKAAVNMLVGLGDLLRHTLQNSGAQMVSLREELEFLELYLGLEQMRFSDRLTIQMNVAPETLEVRVPNLILQPLVENSIRHGIAQRLRSGLIAISSSIQNGSLVIKVQDDGPGMPGAWRLDDNQGIGLSNTQERLRQLYGQASSFTLGNAPGGGAEAVLSLPATLPAPGERS